MLQPIREQRSYAFNITVNRSFGGLFKSKSSAQPPVPRRLDLGLHHLGEAVGMTPHQPDIGSSLVHVGVRFDAAAHKRTTVVGLQHYCEQVLWRLVQVKELSTTAGEVDHRLQRSAAL